MPLRVVLADDSYLLREGIAALIAESDRLELVGAVDDLPTLLAAVDRLLPDAVLTDVRMPPTNTNEGLTAARDIRRRHPSIGVVVLSQHLVREYAADLVEDGAEGVGYLLKERVGDIDELVRALETVAAGGSVLDPKVVEALLALRHDSDRSPLATLSERELEVLQAMAEGRNNTTIASSLFMSERAVEKHITSIFLKLGLSEETDVHRRVMAVLAYLRAEKGG